MPAGVAPLRHAGRGRAGMAGARAARSAGRWPILRLSGIYGPGRNAFVNLAERHRAAAGQAGPGVQPHPCATTSPARCGIWRRRNRGGIFNVTDDEPAPPQDVVAYAAVADGRRAAAGNSLRDRPTFAHGALLLWREQACRQCGDQGRRAIASAFPTTASAFDHMWAAGDWRRRRGAQPDEALVIDAGAETALCVKLSRNYRGSRSRQRIEEP